MISEVLKTYLLDNIGADCIETGLLYSQAVINAVCDVLEAKAAAMPLVVDPIRVAKDGTVLLHDTATATLKRRLLELTAVLTPNVSEAHVLTGVAIHDPEQIRGGLDAPDLRPQGRPDQRRDISLGKRSFL